MGAEVLILMVFLAAVVGCLLSGYPVAFGLGGAGLLVLIVLIGLSALGLPVKATDGWPIVDGASWRDLSPLANDVYGHMAPSVQTLIAIPLFVLMGFLFQRSNVADTLLNGLGGLLQGVRGGQGIAVILVGALLAASTGVVGASIATLAIIAFPTLKKQGYSPGRAGGIVASAGTLGQIIPPSIILLLLADQVGSQFQVSQIGLGDFAPRAITSGDLFRSAMVPALLVVAGFTLCATLIAPAKSAGEDRSSQPWPSIVASLLPPLGLIGLVLGSILFGLADTASAATFGAAGAVVLAAGSRRLRQVAIAVTVLLLLWRLLDGSQQMWPIGLGLFAVLLMALAGAGVRCWRQSILPDALQATLKMTSMIFAIIIGAALFSLCFKAIGGDDLLKNGVSAALNANPWLASLVGGATAEAAQARAALLFLLLLIFLLGFVLEFVEIIVVVLPLLLPLVFSVPPEHLDPAWAAILIALALQTSFLTPPFGFALFYFRGAANSPVPSLALYRAVIPFIAVQLLVLVLVWFFPLLALTG